MLKYLFIIVLLLAPSLSYAAIARDVHDKVAGGVDTGKTLSLNIASGAVLFCLTYAENNSAACSWNGTSMTKIVTATNSANYWLTVFFLGNPTSGTHNLVSSNTSVYNSLYGVSYTGASTANPTVSDNQISASAASITDTLSTANNAWYVGLGNGQSLTGTTNATLLDTDNPTFQADFDSNGAAGSNSMTISRSPNGIIGLAAVALQEPAAAASLQQSILGLVNAFWIW